MTVAAESLNRAIGAAEAERAERFKSGFFPQDVSYLYVASRLEPEELEKLQKNDAIVTHTFEQAMYGRGIQNFRIECGCDHLVWNGLRTFEYILRFQEGSKNDHWTEDLGFKAVIVSYTELKRFHSIVQMVDRPEREILPVVQLQKALRLAKDPRAENLARAYVYFEIYNSTDVARNLRDLLNLALVRPTRVPPKF